MATYTGVAYPRQRSRTRNQRRRKLFARQKLMGAVLLLITIGVFWMASTGTTFEDKDCTAALIMGVFSSKQKTFEQRNGSHR